jgi:hypothetical protein
MGEFTHLDYLLKMMEKFEQEHGHEMGNRKTHKISLIHQHNVDAYINLQKARGIKQNLKEWMYI